MHEDDGSLIYPEQLMVLASIQVLVADKNDPKPVGFGSGCILNHRGRFFLVSVRHVTDDGDLTTYLETNQPSNEQGTPVQPIGGLCYFDLINIDDIKRVTELNYLLQDGEPLDITFAEIKHHINLLQPAMDFGAFKVEKGEKIVLATDKIATPDKKRKYGFFGRTKLDYKGIYLTGENTLNTNLKYSSTIKDFHILLAQKVIIDKNNYEGCSGAPVLDNEGYLIGIVCKIKRNSKAIGNLE